MRVLVILIFSITLSACAGLMMSGSSSGSSKTEKDRAPVSRSSTSAVSDRVMARYAADPVVKGLDLDVSASGGMVTISGVAPTYAAREAAEKLAMTTEGVAAVDNQIDVKYEK